VLKPILCGSPVEIELATVIVSLLGRNSSIITVYPALFSRLVQGRSSVVGIKISSHNPSSFLYCPILATIVEYRDRSNGDGDSMAAF
jgi:hypothetical protein